jgi:hypothetical protein
MASVLSSLSLVAGLLLVGPVLLLAQRETSSGPLAAGPVPDAPFSAVATTIVRRSLPNGTRIDRTATARYFRDRLGRVRVEQALLVWDEAQPQPAERELVTIAPEAGSPKAFLLGPATRTIWLSSREFNGGAIIGGGGSFVLPFRGGRFLQFDSPRYLRARFPDALSNGMREILSIPESSIVRQELGQRTIGGVAALGDRVTMAGTDQAGGVFEIVDERWESRELGLLLESRLADSRLGTVEYRVSDIQRTEPAPDLFVVPTDYASSGLFETGKLTFVNAYNVGANTSDLWLNGRN